MIDTVQAVLLFVIVLLTILFVVLGIQVFFILKDLRMTIRRTNNILENAEDLSNGVSASFSSVSNFFDSASTLRSIANIVSIFIKKKR